MYLNIGLCYQEKGIDCSHIRHNIAHSGGSLKKDTGDTNLHILSMVLYSAGASELLGLEVAGEIKEVGSGVTRFKKGDRVISLLDGGGCDLQT